jgi:hypothetical protein
MLNDSFFPAELPPLVLFPKANDAGAKPEPQMKVHFIVELLFYLNVLNK